MFNKRVNHFKVTTEWPELVNKRILQINNQLQDIQFINQLQFLYARGSIKREIRYMEPDGRFRKTEDKVQFEINLGQSSVGPLPELTVELKQDYYLFLPGRIGEQQAILEQSFILAVQPKEPAKSCEAGEPLLVNSIIATGAGTDHLRVRIKFSESIMPKNFEGTIHFKKNITPPVAEGEIEGVITYRYQTNLMAEIDIKEPVSFLINALTPGPEQCIFISGAIRDINWKPVSTTSDWWLEVKINYEWFLSEPREVFCITDKKNPLEGERIKTAVLLEKNCYEMAGLLSYPISKTAGNIKAEITAGAHRYYLTKKGLLLTVRLICNVIYIDAEGIEKYQEFQSDIEELVPDYRADNFKNNLFFKTAVEAKLVRSDFFNGILKINYNCQYYFSTYLKSLTAIKIDNESTESILAPVLNGQELFSISGEELVSLNYCPTMIIEIKARVIECKPVIQKNRLNINGVLEIAITYTDEAKRLREDKFDSFFQEGFFWEQLENSSEVNLETKLEYDSFLTEGAVVKYKYLISLMAEAFQEKVLKIAAKKKVVPILIPIDTHSPPKPVHNNRIIENLLIERDFLLKKGNIREIIDSQAGISGFEVRDSLRALFIRGDLTGEIEYWDEERYLQKEVIDLPFWQFIDNPGRPADCSRLVPEIIRYNYVPVKNKFWRKDGLKIKVEIELKYEGVDQ